ncbi:MAG TPA: iron chelate uptake ABC transporter family permease subunit, partial [Cyclobacteriaceae bacterium]|nr:iron chelate uptake ABC transporter family permease subunit [Cyclobacteriaceae bacterium]
MKQNSARLAIFILTIALGILFLLNISMGSVSISLPEVLKALFSETGTSSEILWQFRLPKAITCVLAGSALACGGLMMQTLFRNPMAGPDVLGLTSGSSLLVAILLLAGRYGSFITFVQSPWSVALAASLGGAMVFVIIISIAKYVRDNTALLIVGLMISAATSSVVSVLQFTSQADDLQTFMIWMLGSVGSTNWSELVVLTITISMGLG